MLHAARRTAAGATLWALALAAAACTPDRALAPDDALLAKGGSRPTKPATTDTSTTTTSPSPTPTSPTTSPTPAPMPTLVSYGAALPAGPSATVSTEYVAPTGRTLTVSAGGNLQQAIDTAAYGDVIVLQAGATYTGNFLLRAKSAGSGWITIRTSTTDASLPLGVRVSPADASKLARLVTANSMPAVRTENYAHHYRLVGLEIAPTSAVTISYGFVQLGDGNTAQTSTAQVASNVILDRTWVHGTSTLDFSRCIALNSASSAIVDSYVSDCHSKSVDAQAVAGWNGPGPFKLANNYLEASGEVVLFGGADPSISGLIPSDIVIQNNHLTRPVSWKGVWRVKNLFELKNAQRVLVQGNVLENNWTDGQNGFGVIWQSLNQDGKCTWCVVRDVTFMYNRLSRMGGGVNILATGGSYPAVLGSRYYVAHNLIEQLDTLAYTGTRRGFQLIDGVADVTIAHNTLAARPSAAVMMDGAPMPRLAIADNVMQNGDYGVFGGNYGGGTPALNYYAPDGVFRRNVIVGGPASAYPADNFFPATMGDVGFVDWLAGNYAFAAGSPYLGLATDAKNPGADIAAVNAQTAGVVR